MIEHGIIGFWTAFISGLFILLHIPSCDFHWASKIKSLSTFLTKYHRPTLHLATIFAIIHIFLSLLGLIFGVWL